MFRQVNNGKGISEDLEIYFVNYLSEKYNTKAFARAAAILETLRTDSLEIHAENAVARLVQARGDQDG